jgi:hypothetical protein
MNSPIPASALVLVAIITTPRDLEIARVLGWYRIPLRRAPKVIAVDYLAFYQTAAFGSAERWKVNYVAEVKGHELTTRRQLLKDEPDHPRAGEEYYKVVLGPLLGLEQPITAPTWKRLTFLYTTGAYVSQAKTVNDLVVRSEERIMLWRSLRERALQSGQYKPADLPELPLDSELLRLLGMMNKQSNP